MTPDLLPLPEPDASDGDVFIRYTAEAMRAYAAEAVRLALERAQELILQDAAEWDDMAEAYGMRLAADRLFTPKGRK